MKIVILLITFTVLLLMPAFSRSQSIVQIDKGAVIEVQIEADVCADERIVNGILTGGGTWCLNPIKGTKSLTALELFPSLTIKVYLEGFYSPKTPNDKAVNNKRNGDDILSQAADTIRIFLADSLQNYAFVDSVKVFLPSNGVCTAPFKEISAGKYYIAVKHRNHIETWSRYAVSFTEGKTVYYDFTEASSRAYGDNMKQSDPGWVLYGGDMNQDGNIGALDFPEFISQMGKQGYLSCDFNGDNDITEADQHILIQNYGITTERPGIPAKIKPDKSSEASSLVNNIIPVLYKLYQSYPNPFNPGTSIKYDIPIQSFVKLTVYDITGKEIESLVNDIKEPGAYEVFWDGSKYASGAYIYKIDAGKFSEVKKMILLK